MIVTVIAVFVIVMYNMIFLMKLKSVAVVCVIAHQNVLIGVNI